MWNTQQMDLKNIIEEKDKQLVKMMKTIKEKQIIETQRTAVVKNHERGLRGLINGAYKS